MPAFSAASTVTAALLTNRHGDIVSWNAGCGTLFGRPSASVLTQPLASLFAPASQDDLARRWAEFDFRRDSTALDHRDLALLIAAPDGSMRRTKAILLPQFDAGQQLLSCVVFFRSPRDSSEGAMVGSMPLSSVINVLPGTFYVIREDGSFALWNKTLEQVTGMTPDEMAQARVLDMFDQPERRIIEARMRDVFDNEAQVFVEANYLDKSGNTIPYLLCGARIACEGRDYLCGMGLDISQQRQQEERLRLRERAMHATSNGLVITRFEGKDNPIEYVNPAFERITGYTAEEAIGRDSRFMAAPDLDEDQRQQLRDAIRERRELNVVFRNRRKNGEIFWNDLTITPVADGKGKVTHFIGVINDVTAITQRTAHLEHEVNHDALTGLANRTLLWDRLEQAIHLAQRNKTLVATVLIDLDGFKQINDTFGHEAGDEVLTVVARRLQASVRDSDTVARLSGDEFVLVLVNQPSLRYTLRMIERLRAGLSKTVTFDNAQISVAASMGVAVYPHDGSGALELVRAADTAMYHAKSTRTSEVHFFSSDMKSSTEAKQKLEDALRAGIERQELFLQFQPRICLRSGAVTGLEALLRWRHPEQGIMLPGSFLQDAEENGLIVPISHFVIEQACAFLALLKTEGSDTIPVSINTSYREFSQPHYVEQLAAALAMHGVPPHLMEVEVREESLNLNHHLGLDILSQLRELGVQCSVDAFGDGLSDLAYLQKLPLSHVKLSSQVVQQITLEATSGALSRTLISLGHHLGAPVVAKSVENQVQADFLRANGCDEIQGRFYSEPMPGDAVRAMLASIARPALNRRS